MLAALGTGEDLGALRRAVARRRTQPHPTGCRTVMLPALAHVTFRGAGHNAPTRWRSAAIDCGKRDHPVCLARKPSRPRSSCSALRPCISLVRAMPQYFVGALLRILWARWSLNTRHSIAGPCRLRCSRCGRGRQHRSKHRRHSLTASGASAPLSLPTPHSSSSVRCGGRARAFRRSLRATVRPAVAARAICAVLLPLRGHDTLALGALS